MPPPRPHFLPPNHHRRRHLDPTRHLTSRELWNQVRFHAPHNNGEANASHKEYYSSLLKAILYEIQPFRIKPALRHLHIFLQEDGVRKSCALCLGLVKAAASSILRCFSYIYKFVRSVNPKSIRSFYQSNSTLLQYGTLTSIGLYIYYRLISYLHETLHAGPMAFILTLMVLLYTIGLGDNTGAASGIPSAYSVFNRGVQRLLGQEDAEVLANQFVRAAAGRGLGGGRVGRDGRGFQGENFWVDDNDAVEGDDEQDVVNERRRRRRLERLQRRTGDDDGNLTENEIDDSMEEDKAPERNENTTARKSGKKARRRNLELRREMQRQRQAAAALGFGANNAEIREMEAMDRFLDHE